MKKNPTERASLIFFKTVGSGANTRTVVELLLSVLTYKQLVKIFPILGLQHLENSAVTKQTRQKKIT